MTNRPAGWDVAAGSGQRPVRDPQPLRRWYGLNARHVRTAGRGWASPCLVTVDNGIRRREALERAPGPCRWKGSSQRSTTPCHRSIPPTLALLHPACTPEGSPYRVCARVGLAYVLAVARTPGPERPPNRHGASICFCIGTIADMLPVGGEKPSAGARRAAAPACSGLAACRRCNAWLAWGTPPSMHGCGLFNWRPPDQCVGRLGNPRWGGVAHHRRRTNGMELAQEWRSAQTGNAASSDVDRGRSGGLVESGRPERTPFLLLAKSMGNMAYRGGGRPAGGTASAWPVALLAGEGPRTLALLVRAPRGLCCGSGPEPLPRRCWSPPIAGTPGGRWLHRAGLKKWTALHQALNGLAGDWLRKGRKQRCPRWSQKPGSPWTGHPNCLANLQRLRTARCRPGRVRFWSARLQRSIDTAPLLAVHLQSTLKQGECRPAGRLPGRWQGEGPVHQVMWPSACASKRWQGEERCNSTNWWPCAPVAAEKVVLQRRERTYWCRPRWGDLF